MSIVSQSPYSIGCLAWTPDSKRLATTCYTPDSSPILIWDVASGARLASLADHTEVVVSAAFSDDGMMLASGSYDSTVRLWGLTTSGEWRCLEVLRAPAKISSVAWGEMECPCLVSGDHANTVRIWHSVTGACLDALHGHTDIVSTVDWCPVDQYVASGSHDNTVRVWSTVGGECLKTLKGHTDTVLSVAFSPDGRLLASGSYDDTLRLWDATTGDCIKTLHGHTGPVMTVAWSRDGTRLASGGGDETVRVWDMAGGKEAMATLTWHTEEVTSVAWSPTIPRCLASASMDKTIRLWNF